MARFNNTDLTEETIAATRQWFADNSQACIADALAGTTRVNNIESYVAFHEDAMLSSLAGDSDHTFAFLQRAYFIQTGESVPLFAR